MITSIETGKIHPHPNNPRKDLGDLTELAESIKVSGILQNLTVVPKGEEYTVIIGHRRLAAAKLAGLTEVPCAITNMDEKIQIATMLLENMQRSDLTVYEQAQGIQMMIDLGETVSNISEKTGFSEATVRRRVKLLELDQDKFKKSVERGATLMDYMELEKIHDPNLRNSVLEKIGTSNFNYALQEAIGKEKKDKAIAGLIKQLDTFATKVEAPHGAPNGMRYIKSYYGSAGEKFEKPEDAGTAKYFYAISSWRITLYGEAVKVVETEQDTTANEQRAKQQANQNALKEISKRAYTLRYDFVRNLSNTKAKKNIGIISEYAVDNMLNSDDCYNFDLPEYAGFFGIEVKENDDGEYDFNNIADHLRKQPELYLLAATYLSIDSDTERYFNWECKHDKNETLDRVYTLLEALGYELSDEEQALRDGTHELLISE